MKHLTFIISTVMIITSFVGVLLMQIGSKYAWEYWQALSLFFALLCFFLGYYFRKVKALPTISTLWHELLHWVGLLLCVFLLSQMVEMGSLGRFEASLMVLILLGFSIFIVGVYLEPPLMIVGGIMGCSALALSFFNEYFYSLFFPAALVILGIWLVYLRMKASKENT